ncbi:glycoside hydrolase family 15 protein [Ruania halotolerans]|uniref:glycoside hydrolase family 15 protein n=1 Tax=Ruania halotolerans TaxID=2897773 RepID=UPI001E3B1855|nr:glycoside hydrolase family 15 protein [Ruania halotolerans]UFU08024.1 glycoside hydrolase family 15 protein [Ruania halotolerans]
MSSPIGDYALLADLHTGPLVSAEGSIDWLCLPRFDSDSVFAAILGTPDHGRWLMAPAGGTLTERIYEPGTFVLRSTWTTPTGTAEITEFMPIDGDRADIVRIARCTSGEVAIVHDLRLRPEYAASLPWVRRVPDGPEIDRSAASADHADGEDGGYLLAIAGPDAYVLRGPALTSAGHCHEGTFTLTAGQEEVWDLTWAPSFRQTPAPLDVAAALASTREFWRDWAARAECEGPWAEAVERSLLVLRALTHAETGGIVAAPTTSLPEDPGGVRNWDYRFCWLRDSALTLEALLAHGRTEVAHHWRDWLLRAVAGDPEDLQIMYGIAGERQLPERTLGHLPGHLDSRPVRIGNGAVGQFQADVVGEVMIALDQLRAAGVAEDDFSWPLQRAMIDYAVDAMGRKDQGLWEMRGDAHYFTHSRVMIWAALDRGVRAVAEYGLPGPAQEWARLRDQLREEILSRGVHPETGAFTQHYDTREVDASLLQIPQTGFVAYDDRRMLATVAQMEAELRHDGLLLRYRTNGTDGLSGDEYPFLACSFWLVEQYAHSGRRPDAVALMDRLVGLRTELGLLAEEYDPAGSRQMGNFPQAFSHLALVRAADALGQ